MLGGGHDDKSSHRHISCSRVGIKGPAPPQLSPRMCLCVLLISKLLTRGTIPAMALKTKTFLMVLLLVFVFISPSPGLVEGFRESQYRPHDLLHKGGMKMNSRKLLSHGFELDYDDAGANPRHTRKPGKGT